MSRDPLALANFLSATIDPETRAINAEIEASMKDAPPMDVVPLEVLRDQRLAARGVFPEVPKSDRAVERRISGPAGEIGLRIVVPRASQTPKGVYLHIHGGGWVLGSNDQNDPGLERMADKHGLVGISIAYRLAPEDPYPAGPDDCEAAALWLIENAKAEFGTDVLTIGGESAGANLAATTLLRLRDKHGYTGIKAANMIFGVFDVAMTPSAANWGDRRLVINTPAMRWFGECFVPDPAMRRSPDVSPLYAELSDMPPAIFTVGSCDPLLDDSLFMHARWLAAGNPAVLAVYPGGVHGFVRFPGKIARQALARVDEFIGEALTSIA